MNVWTAGGSDRIVQEITERHTGLTPYPICAAISFVDILIVLATNNRLAYYLFCPARFPQFESNLQKYSNQE